MYSKNGIDSRKGTALTYLQYNFVIYVYLILYQENLNATRFSL